MNSQYLTFSEKSANTDLSEPEKLQIILETLLYHMVSHIQQSV